MPVVVEIDGVGKVELGDEFKALSPQEQQSTIEGIVASVRRGAKPDVGQAESFVRGAADMASFGFADELTAGVKTGAGFLGDYDKQLAETRGAYKAAQEANPLTYLGGQVVGGVGSTLLTGGTSLAGQGAGIGAKVLSGMGRGIAEGAAYGFGSGEDGLANRALNAAGGAAIGGVAGGVAPVIGSAVSKSADWLKSSAGNAINQAIPSRRLSPVERKAAGMVANQLDQVGQTVDDAAKGVSEGRVLAQQSPANADYLASIARQNPGATRNSIIEGATENLRDSRDLLKTAMREGVSGEKNSYEWLTKFKANNALKAKQAYGSVYKTAATPDPNVTDFLLNNMDMQWYTAARRIGGKGFVPLTKDASGNLTFGRVPTLQEAEIFRRALADRTTSAYKAGYTNAGQSLKSAEQGLRQVLDAAHPDLAAARRQFADDKAIEEAFEVGKKAFGGNAEEVGALVNNMGQAEREAFSKGYWSAIRGKVDGKTIGSTFDFKRAFETEDGAAILNMAMQKSADPTRKAAQQWDEAANLYAEVTGNSATAKRMGDDAMTRAGQAIDTAASMASGSPEGIARGLLSAAQGLFRNPPSEAELQQVAAIMMQRDPVEFQKVMRGYFAGDKVARERLRNIIGSVVTSGARSAGIGGGSELIGIR